MVQLRAQARSRANGDDGVSLVLVALCMVAVLAIAAIVVDLGNARQVRREAQGAADASAVAAAQDLPIAANSAATRLGKQTAARNTAITYAVRNVSDPNAAQYNSCNTNYTCSYSSGGFDIITTTPWNPTTNSIPANANSSVYIGQMAYIHVQICTNTPTFFAGVVQQKSPRVCRSAVGRYTQIGGGFDYGLVATHPSSCFGLRFSGNEATTLTSNGAVMINSNCSSGQQALNAPNNSYSLKFLDSSNQSVQGYVGVVGGTAVNLDGMSPTLPTTGISPFGDPLSGLIDPSNPGAPNRSCPGNGGGTISPGRYPNDCKVSNGDINIEPGIYYLEKDLDISGGSYKCVDSATATCAGTGILFYSKGQISINGNGVVDLPPYRMSCASYYTGTCYDGMSLWQVGSSKPAMLNGNSSFTLGTIYVPNAQIQMNGTAGDADKIQVTGIVVGSTVDLIGNLNLNIIVPLDAPDILSAVDLGLEK